MYDRVEYLFTPELMTFKWMVNAMGKIKILKFL